MNWTKRILIAAFLVLLPTSAAFAQDVTPLDQFQQRDVERVRTLLLGYHDIADASILERIENADAIVESLAHNTDGVVRDRALAALGRYWPSADVYLLYANLLAADDTPEGTRHRLLLQFATVFGERALPTVGAYLNDRNEHLQLTAVQALARIGTDEAFERIDAYADQIDDPARLAQVDRLARTVR